MGKARNEHIFSARAPVTDMYGGNLVRREAPFLWTPRLVQHRLARRDPVTNLIARGEERISVGDRTLKSDGLDRRDDGGPSGYSLLRLCRLSSPSRPARIRDSTAGVNLSETWCYKASDFIQACRTPSWAALDAFRASSQGLGLHLWWKQSLQPHDQTDEGRIMRVMVPVSADR